MDGGITLDQNIQDKINDFMLEVISTDEFKEVDYLIFSIRKQYLNYMSSFRLKNFNRPEFLDNLIDKVIDLFNETGISTVDMLQYMMENDINGWVHYYANTFIIPIAQGNKIEIVDDLSDLYAQVLTGYILDSLGFRSYDIEKMIQGEKLSHERNSYGLSVVNGIEFHRDYFIYEDKAYLYSMLTNTNPISFGDDMPGFARIITDQIKDGKILLRLDDRLALPKEQAISYSTLNFEKYRGPQFHFKDTVLETVKTIIVHGDNKTYNKLLLVIKQRFDEKKNKPFWHIEIETLPYKDSSTKAKKCITTFLHGMYYPTEDCFTHIDYTKNQYDMSVYLKKYADCVEGVPIDTYTETNDLHHKIWCVEDGTYSRETWYKLMIVSLEPGYARLLDEMLEATVS